MGALLAAKIALEAEVSEPILAAATTYISEWARSGGQVTLRSKSEHYGVFEQVLLRHYARVCMVVTGRQPDAEARVETAALSVTHANQLRLMAMQQSLLIVAGIERELARALVAVESKARGATETKGSLGSFTIRMVGKFVEAAKIAASAIKKKLPAIANAQTQGVAEGAIIEWVNPGEADSTIVKVWSTMQDERVRHTHEEAEGQERRVDQSFDVGGYRLRFPGDGGLGAPLRETINCRCSAHYFAVDANGNRRDLGIPTVRVPTRPTRPPGSNATVSPLQPTELVTLNGRTTARVVLGNGSTIATMRQTSPGTITISVNRRQIARASHSNGVVTDVVIATEYQPLGIEKLIRRSVEHSFQRTRR